MQNLRIAYGIRNHVRNQDSSAESKNHVRNHRITRGIMESRDSRISYTNPARVGPLGLTKVFELFFAFLINLSDLEETKL